MKEPELPEILLQAAKTGLPEIEAHKFYNYYGSKGWVVGRSPMKNWHMAMAGWKLRWQQCQQHAPAMTNTDKILRTKELERIEARILFIRGNHGVYPEFSPEERKELASLKARKWELMELLGLMV